MENAIQALQEWLDDLDVSRNLYHYISHLYGLFPSNQKSPFKHNELYSAASNTLKKRGDKEKS